MEHLVFMSLFTNALEKKQKELFINKRVRYHTNDLFMN